MSDLKVIFAVIGGTLCVCACSALFGLALRLIEEWLI